DGAVMKTLLYIVGGLMVLGMIGSMFDDGKPAVMSCEALEQAIISHARNHADRSRSEHNHSQLPARERV
ncbi:MAG: hypothetical protein ABWZ57_16790, partial [Mesorhizobium sp.]